MFLSLTLQELPRRVSLDSLGPWQNNPVLSSSGSQQPSEADWHLPWSCRTKVKSEEWKNLHVETPSCLTALQSQPFSQLQQWEQQPPAWKHTQGLCSPSLVRQLYMLNFWHWFCTEILICKTFITSTSDPKHWRTNKNSQEQGFLLPRGPRQFASTHI